MHVSVPEPPPCFASSCLDRAFDARERKLPEGKYVVVLLPPVFGRHGGQRGPQSAGSAAEGSAISPFHRSLQFTKDLEQVQAKDL